MLDRESLTTLAAVAAAALAALREELTADVELSDLGLAQQYVGLDNVRHAVERLLSDLRAAKGGEP